ncbi:hypothetical protein [Halobacillus litoralis]|uniref:hypothetical protein n=1 Tax=Halobacillus litoralis TaxID=45668 RepID=UPI001CFD512D|nr:hypothetical protein [Halobacillus litoralis]
MLIHDDPSYTYRFHPFLNHAKKEVADFLFYERPFTLGHSLGQAGGGVKERLPAFKEG